MSGFTKYAASAIKATPAYDLPLDLARHVRKEVEGTAAKEVYAYDLYRDLSHDDYEDDGFQYIVNNWRHVHYLKFMSILEGFGIRKILGRRRPTLALRDLDGDLLPEWVRLFDALDRYEAAE
jgi:hypothetical protein